MDKGMESEGHWHVSVFHGHDRRFAPGLVLLRMADATWEVCDETGQIGPPDTTYGTWPSVRTACQEALRLLRSHFGEGTFPCWGAGAPNRAFAELRYKRGRVRWRWWPPRPHQHGRGASGTGWDAGDVRPARSLTGGMPSMTPQARIGNTSGLIDSMRTAADVTR